MGGGGRGRQAPDLVHLTPYPWEGGGRGSQAPDLVHQTPYPWEGGGQGSQEPNQIWLQVGRPPPMVMVAGRPAPPPWSWSQQFMLGDPPSPLWACLWNGQGS